MRYLQNRILGTLLLSSLFSVLAAPQTKQASPAPVPPQILAAKKVFIGNAGGEDVAVYTGGPDRAYNQLYAAIKNSGRFELLSAPTDADLLFEISFVLGPYERPVVKGDSVGTQTFDPRLRLVIRDPKTNALLWSFTVHAEWAIFQGNRDKNFDAAMSKLVDSLQKIAAPPPANATSGTVPQNYRATISVT
jgi:hypothetical protein